MVVDGEELSRSCLRRAVLRRRAGGGKGQGGGHWGGPGRGQGGEQGGEQGKGRGGGQGGGQGDRQKGGGGGREGGQGGGQRGELLVQSEVRFLIPSCIIWTQHKGNMLTKHISNPNKRPKKKFKI